MRTEYRLWYKETDCVSYHQCSLYPTREAAAMATSGPDLPEWKVGGNPENRWLDTKDGSWMITPESVPESLEDRVKLATDMAVEYGPYDGDHHKAWVIDQMLRHLAGDGYHRIIPSDWEPGVAP